MMKFLFSLHEHLLQVRKLNIPHLRFHPVSRFWIPYKERTYINEQQLTHLFFHPEPLSLRYSPDNTRSPLLTLRCRWQMGRTWFTPMQKTWETITLWLDMTVKWSEPSQADLSKPQQKSVVSIQNSFSFFVYRIIYSSTMLLTPVASRKTSQ